MSSSDVRRRERILKGNLFQAVLFICLPLAVYQLFNSAYNLIDQVICAQISTTAQNAVASIGQLKNAISAFGGGLAAGGAVFVSRFFGAGKIKDAKHASANLLFLSIVVSVVLMILLIPLAKPIMQLCQIAPESIEIGIGFFRLQLLELAFIGINNVFLAINLSSSVNYLGFINLAIGILGTFGCIKLLRKRKRMKQECQLFE